MTTTKTKAIAKAEGTTAILSTEIFGDSTIEAFVASRHPAPNTAKTYRNSIRQLLKFFAQKNISVPTTADIDTFINSLREKKNGKKAKSDSTIRLYVTTTKLFFAYLSKKDLYKDVAADVAPLKLRKSTTHKKNTLTDAQAKKLLNAIEGNDIISLRNKAIIALALTTGLRTCEISRANVEHFKDCGAYFTLDVIGKGHREADATVKVAAPVAEMIQAYLDKRGSVYDDEPLFTSTSHNVNWKKNSYGVRYSEQSVGKMIKAAMQAAGITDKKITAHSTRHYAATTAIKAGIDIREVSAMLRHTSITITAVYLHDLSLQTRRAELAVADALFCA